jgi:DNA-binding NarL/FixJ family response regulator
MPIKVLIADDHVFYREGVRALLSNVPELEVVGEANNGEEAIMQANELHPNVILMDSENARHERHRRNPQDQ